MSGAGRLSERLLEAIDERGLRGVDPASRLLGRQPGDPVDLGIALSPAGPRRPLHLELVRGDGILVEITLDRPAMDGLAAAEDDGPEMDGVAAVEPADLER